MYIGTHSVVSAYTIANAQPAAADAQTRAASADPEAPPRRSDDATVVTVSEEARTAMASMDTGDEPAVEQEDTEDVVARARRMLNELLAEAERSSPLEDGRLALDMSRLDQAGLHAIATNDDGLFTSDERAAAGLELERRFGQALSGPAEISEVAQDYRVVYRAAAEHMDAMSDARKAEPAWIAAREAIDIALDRLALDPTEPPADIPDDPVASYLAARPEHAEQAEPKTPAEAVRALLDEEYRKADEAGLRATLDPRHAAGRYLVDLSKFDSMSLSAIALNEDGLFSPEETAAAGSQVRTRGNAALMAAFRHAGDSGDPLAFAGNIISLYSSMSPAELQAAGWSENLMGAALASYETNMRLMSLFESAGQPAGGSNWFSF